MQSLSMTAKKSPEPSPVILAGIQAEKSTVVTATEQERGSCGGAEQPLRGRPTVAPNDMIGFLPPRKWNHGEPITSNGMIT